MKHTHPARSHQEKLALRARGGDRKAAAALMASMMPFVKAIVSKMSGEFRGLDGQDLEQEGAIAILRSLPTYDPSIGSFHTRAWQWALNAMQREIYRNLSLIRLPQGGDRTGAVAIVTQIRKSETADTESLSEEIGVSEKRVRAIYDLCHGHLSIDSGGDGEGFDLPDGGDSPEDIAIRKEEMSNFERALAFFRGELTAAETIIFDGCIMAYPEDRITVTQAAVIAEIPRSTAYWIYNRLLSRLRQRMGRR